MKNRLIFFLAILGILAGIAGAYFFGVQHKPQPPAFKPASNPFEKGIYANGIVESYQASGENINIYPEVAGSVAKIMVSEGETVKKGMPLIQVDDSVEKATADAQKAQADSAKAQIGFAKATLKNLQDQYDKQKRSYALNPKSVSTDALDTAKNAVEVAKASLDVAKKQYVSSLKTYRASKVLLSKYLLSAPTSGQVLSIDAAIGGYVSPQGSFDSYTAGFGPPLVMGKGGEMAVRCYVDEILIQRLPKAPDLHAKMFIRGTDISVPLEYVRVQPYVSPKIELSNQRTERVDVRVLPLIFKFAKPQNLSLYPGQLVDVYIGEKE